MAASPDWQPRLQQALDPLAEQMNGQELLWASGYLAGVAVARGEHHLSAVDADPASEAVAGEVLHIWYGSQTGNGRGVAERLAAQAQAGGLSVALSDLAEVAPRQIRKIKLLTLVVSTHGEGDPPDDAEALHEYLHGEQAPKLGGLRYSVFALGDSSYEHFCQTGKDVDAALEKLGAERALARADADVDFEYAADAWRSRVIDAFKDVAARRGDAQPGAVTRGGDLRLVSQVVEYSRDNPWQAEVLATSPLTVAPSGKTVHHVELSLEGSGLHYEPGDSLGVWPRNPAPLVEEFLEILKLHETAPVRIDDDELPAREWLSRRLELTQLTRPFLEQYGRAARADELNAVLNDAGRLRGWIERHQVIDVLREFPAGLPAEELFSMLRALAPRSYSIASSPLAAPDEVHLTVRTVGGWQTGGTGALAPTGGRGNDLPQWPSKRLRAGAASWHLNSGLKPGERAGVFLEPNKRFRLPKDPDTPVIMIGPGTGVAPFRAFVEQRKALGAGGRNWLFFGEQHRRTDFLYQIEWQRHLKSGALHRLSPAFSRDQEHRIYVQDRVREQGREVYDWLESGAHLYVCGDATRMAPDVERALQDVIAEHAGTDAERATGYLKAMKQQGRYRKDVY